MKIIYTKHALKKFFDLRLFGIFITKARIRNTIKKPKYRSLDNGNLIVSASFDTDHNLGVVYNQKKDDIRVDMAKIKYRYDKEDDVLMVFLGKGKIEDAQQSGNIISHFSASGELLLLEILDASKFLAATSKILPSQVKQHIFA